MKKLFEKIKQNFEFFEKKQGRPSKETLKKRKIFYASIALIFIVVILCITSFTLSKINKNKLKGEVSTTERFTFSEDSYDNNDEANYNYKLVIPENINYYKLCVYDKNNSDSYEQIFCTNDIPDNNNYYLSPFSKEDTKKQYKISIQVFDDNNYTEVNKNMKIWKPNGWKIDSSNNNAYAEFIVDPSIEHVACINDEVKSGVNHTFSNLTIFKRIINFLYRMFGLEPPYKVDVETKQLGIIQKKQAGKELIISSDEISDIKVEGTYNTIFKLQNTYNNSAFYKIIKFSDIDMTTIIDKGTCIAFKGNVDAKASFKLSSANKEAVGIVKVFLSRELCEAEDGNYTKPFSSSVTKYKFTETTTTTMKMQDNKIQPKMVLTQIKLYDKTLSTNTVKKTFNKKEYNVHEITNEGQVNIKYNITKNVSGTYYRKMYMYNAFEGGKLINEGESYCRVYDAFSGAANDDFQIGTSQSSVRTEFRIYSDANCTNEVTNSRTTDYFLYSPKESSISGSDGSVRLTAYGYQETACIGDKTKFKNAIYNDPTYGNVRVIAANKLRDNYGCGTIVELKGKIQLEDKTVDTVKAIVLDVGGTSSLKNGTVFDLMLNCSEVGDGSLNCSSKNIFYTNPMVSYKVLRKGYVSSTKTTTTKNTSNNITIKLEDKGGRTKDSNNTVLVSELTKYYVKATVTQTKGATLYYRWDTYNGLNAKNHNFTDTSSNGNYSYCSSFKSNSVEFNSLESLDFYDKNTPRSGKFSLYSSQSDCKNGKNAVKSAVINYDYQDISTSKEQYKTVNYNFNEINSKFGAQAPRECYKAAMTYGAWIAQKIDRSDIMKLSPDYSRSEWGNNYYTSDGNTKDVYDLIIKRIDAGKPVVVHGSCKDDYYWSHWVTVVGYKNGINKDNAKASDFLVIDPIEPMIKTLSEALPGGLGGDANFERIWW